MVGNDENIVLDCYRLAKYYGCSPEIFLAMNIDDVQLHLYRTAQLSQMMRREAEEAEDG